jgi:hypothetical protein
VGKPEGTRPLGRPRSRWVNSIVVGLREIGWDVMDWIDLAQDRDKWRSLVNTVMNLRFISILDSLLMCFAVFRFNLNIFLLLPIQLRLLTPVNFNV